MPDDHLDLALIGRIVDVRMWSSIVALHGRYPQALAHLKDGWWKDSAHVETLCAVKKETASRASDSRAHRPTSGRAKFVSVTVHVAVGTCRQPRACL